MLGSFSRALQTRCFREEAAAVPTEGAAARFLSTATSAATRESATVTLVSRLLQTAARHRRCRSNDARVA